jgi:uncharacterized protein
MAIPELTLLTALSLFAVAIMAGFVDSIAGGGGLLTIPALLAAGLPPTSALATNKLQSCFGSFMASWTFTRHGMVQPGKCKLAFILTFIGAGAGAWTVQLLDNNWLAGLMPFLLLAIAFYVLYAPRLGDEDARQRLSYPLFSIFLGGGIGFYDGFFGPGTGSFFALSFVGLLGYGLARATAHAKLLNFSSNLASLLLFSLGGQVIIPYGLAMAGGQALGAMLGARLVLRHGSVIIRPLLVITSLALTARLIYVNADKGLLADIFAVLLPS